jgi:hypothetical protein
MNLDRATGLGLWFPELMNRISQSKDLSNDLRICDMMTAKPIQINETISFPKVGRKKQIFNWYQKAQLFKINDTQIKSFFPKILNL